MRLGESQKRWRTHAIFLILLWILLLAASLSLLSVLLTTFLRSSAQSQSLMSLDWAGYAVTSNLLSPQPKVVGVNSSWTVPEVTVTAFDSFSAVWIGVGGQVAKDGTLIQAGTEQDSISDQAQYSVWYELLPADSVTITTVNVLPGDVITASINLVNPDANEWNIKIYDTTNGQGFSQNFIYDSSRLSAEWIVERPTVNNRLANLADFGSIAFAGSSVTVGSTVGNINHFPYSQFIMNNRQNTQLTSVSPLSSDGSGFTVNYLTRA
jgi:hypothetical protein